MRRNERVGILRGPDERITMTDEAVKRWKLAGGYMFGLVAPEPDISLDEL